MHRIKIQYLSDDNYQLKKQNDMLKKILANQKMSKCNQLSLVFQIKQQNQELRNTLENIKTELLLEKEVRAIEKRNSEEEIAQLNKVVFQLRKEIQTLEALIKNQQKKQINFVAKWFEQQFNKSEHQTHYDNPVILFQVLDELLKQKVENQEWINRTRASIHAESGLQLNKKEEDIQEQHSQSMINFVENGPRVKQSRKWTEGQSNFYFIKKKQKVELFLKLQRVKNMQYMMYNSGEDYQKATSKLQDIRLLKKSYLSLVQQYRILESKNRLQRQYIEELQARNHLLLHSISDSSQEYEFSK